MFAFIISGILMFASAGTGEESGVAKFYNDYLNIPGFEAWKFLNLAIFVAILVYLLKRPLSGAFKAKREAIRAELIRAEEEKQAALSRLAEAEAKLTRLEAERAEILKRAQAEAAADKQRQIEQTQAEVEKLRRQAENEIARHAHLVRAELRRFSADKSIRLAEQKLRSQIDAEKDARLVKANIQSIGGLN